MTVVIPKGVTTGKVVVTTPGGKAHQQRNFQNHSVAYRIPQGDVAD